MNLIRQIAKTLLTVVAPSDRLLVRGPRASQGRPRIALTFDDGPHPDHTPRLLDRLSSLGLQATFFVIGRQAEKFPELVRRMAEEGHEVANHTYSHSEPKQTSAAKFLEEVRQTDELLSSITGQTPATVRPPKGELTWSKLRGLWRAKKNVVLWNIDPKDFRMTSNEEMKTWSRSYQPADRDIVLLHDIHPYAVQAIESLAAEEHFERLETVTISGWLEQARTQRSHASAISPAGSSTL